MGTRENGENGDSHYLIGKNKKLIKKERIWSIWRQ